MTAALVAQQSELPRTHAISTTVRLLSYALFLTGLTAILLSVVLGDILLWSPVFTSFLRDIGVLLSAVMAGTILHEKLLREEMMHEFRLELEDQLHKQVPQLEAISHRTAREAHQLFCENPPGMTGLRFLNESRRGYAGYYSWITERHPQELFFAGRSVLHRIDADIRAQTRGPHSLNGNGVGAEDIMFRRLGEGSKITVLFVDPRTDILERLATEEGQTLDAMAGDIAKTLGVCRRLYDLLSTRSETRNWFSAGLTIRVYDRMPYFAYHQADDRVVVGFYFLSRTGYSSAAYEIVDDKTKQVFAEHFIGILSESATNTLVEFDGARGGPRFNEPLYLALRARLANILGEQRTAELVDLAPSLGAVDHSPVALAT